jgi:hypothetical protein
VALWNLEVSNSGLTALSQEIELDTPDRMILIFVTSGLLYLVRVHFVEYGKYITPLLKQFSAEKSL